MSISDVGTEAANPLAKLLVWAGDRPGWQRDFLRVIAANEVLDKDLQLRSLGVVRSSFPEFIGPPQSAESLDASHLPTSEEESTKTDLVSIGNIVGMGKISSNQVLRFDVSPGLNIIYGDNGSGKSGYAKILKASTGSVRNQDHDYIVGDVFSGDFSPTATSSAQIEVATIDASENTASRETHLIAWNKGDDLNRHLSTIRVFDQDSAGIYVSGTQEISYLPPQLELLTRLGDEQAKLKEIVDSELSRLAQEDINDSAGIDSEALLVAVPRGLVAEVDDAAIMALTKWEDSKDRPRLIELESMLREGENQRQRLVALKEGLDKILSSAREIAPHFAQQKVADIKKAKEDEIAARVAKELASDASFQDPGVYPVVGTGSDAWKHLYEAAKNFVVGAGVSSDDFPPSSEEDYCALCQQNLDAAAVRRFRSFEDYVSGEAIKLADASTKILTDLKTSITELNWDASLAEATAKELELQFKRFEGDVLPTLSDEEFPTTIQSFGQLVADAKAAMVQFIENGDIIPEYELPTIIPDLDKLSIFVSSQIEQLSHLQSEDGREELEDEYNDLVLREIMHPYRENMLRIKYRDIVRQNLTKANVALATRAVSDAKRSLRNELFDETYKTIFNLELEKLEVGIEVKVSLAESQGTTTRSLDFGVDRSSTKLIRGGSVLSEGEHRAIALAAYFTELEALPSGSAAIIDDPVSSLDHFRKLSVAKRVIELAKSRQVVVFTHDLTFAFDLQAQAENKNVARTLMSIRRSTEGSGIVRPDGPPGAIKVKKRFNRLEQDVATLTKKYNAGSYDTEESERWAKLIGGEIRDAFEALVEKELLGGVVERFQTAVSTKKLRSVAIPDDIFELVYEGMSNSSEWSHDDPGARNRPPPSPKALEAEVCRAKGVLDLISQQRKELESRRSN